MSDDKRDKRAAIDELILNISSLGNDEISSLISDLEEEERRLSSRRKELHAQIDAVKKRLTTLLSERLRDEQSDFADAALLKAAETLVASSRTVPLEVLAEEEERTISVPDDLSSLDFARLNDIYHALQREEAKVSYKRRVTQGTIDILKNELLARLESVAAPKEASDDRELVERIAKILSSRGF